MGLWLITDPKAEMIFGTVQAPEQAEAYRRIDKGEADWFWQAGPHEQLAVHAPFTLADGRWREAAPGWPLPAGDCGGDYQASEALGRRWWLVHRDGTFALFDVSWYTTDDTDAVDNPTGPMLERQEEFLICNDLRWPGDTEIWADYRYLTELTWEPVESNVMVAARDFDPATEITWDGKEFR